MYATRREATMLHIELAYDPGVAEGEIDDQIREEQYTLIHSGSVIRVCEAFRKDDGGVIIKIVAENLPVVTTDNAE